MPKGEDAKETRWTRYAKEHLVGRTIVAVSYVSQTECESLGWASRPLAFQLDNGTMLYAMSDEEGNDGGTLAGATKTGDELVFPVL